ncbi:MAG: hypothetical protein NVS3B20_23460 [Polyangiales bacterium]
MKHAREILTPQRLRKVFDDATALAGFTVAVQTTVEAVLQAPEFLYREELGAFDAPTTGGTGAGKGAVPLTPYEMAAELSFFLTGSIPDATLMSAADQGHLVSPSDVDREGTRLLATPRAQENLREFFNQWLATNRLPTLTKDPVVYPTFTPQLALDMASELNAFIDDTIWKGTGTLNELFTSNNSFVSAPLATLYGLPAGGAAGKLQQVSLSAKDRKGILTRAGYLAAHSSPNNSSPIARGVFVLDSLLCAPPGAPPTDVLQRAKMQPVLPNETTRQHFANHSADPFCKGCHKFIDGVGFGFEAFDGIGAFRTVDNGSPVDSSGNLMGTSDSDGPFNGVSELSAKIVKSEQFKGCYVTQVFRFAMGTVETASDKCTLQALGKDFSVNKKVTSLFLSFANHPAFAERIPE